MRFVSDLLLTDSTMPVSFCDAGANLAGSLLTYLGDRLHMVADVHEELERKAEGSAALRAFLGAFPDERVRVLDLSVAAKVAEARKAVSVAGTHPREDVGEIASVFYAEVRREQGEEFTVITDDHYGKTLARDRQLKVVTTPSLVVEMVCAEALAYADGERVWRACFTNRDKWKGFGERVRQYCSERELLR